MDTIGKWKNDLAHVGYQCMHIVTQSLWDGVVGWVSVLLPRVLHSLKIIIKVSK